MHPSVQENAYGNGCSVKGQLSSCAELCGVKFWGRMQSKGIRPPLICTSFQATLQTSPGPGARLQVAGDTQFPHWGKAQAKAQSADRSSL